MFRNKVSLPSRLKTLVFLTLVVLFAGSTFGQAGGSVRKGIYKAKRQLMTESNRTKRDIKQMKRALGSDKRSINPAVDTTDFIEWSKKPYIPNSGMIHDYRYLYTFLHQEQEYLFSRDSDLVSIQWDSLENVFYKNVGENRGLAEGVEVMGWHPHWMEESYKYYNYNLLSKVSYYSYNINPVTGGCANQDIVDQLKASSLMDSTSKNGVEGFISVTSFGRESNHTFLIESIRQSVFADEIIALLDEFSGKMHGIDLNFEQLHSSDRDRFTSFIKYLYNRLNTKGYQLILDVPYFNDSSIFDYAELRGHVDLFNVMGYDFSGEYSTYPGSIAPLRGLSNQPSLETAVNDLLNIGIDGQQIILSLPLYGVTWDITRLDLGEISFYERSLPYYEIRSKYVTQYNPFFDPLTSSFFIILEEDRVKKMCWYENEISLDLKFQWLLAKNLKGVGLWALGYDQGAPEIWKAIDDNFRADSLVVIEPKESKLSGPYGIVKDIIRYKKVIGFGYLCLVGFIFLGFVLSLKDWRVREILFKEQTFRNVYGFLFVLLALLGIEWWWLEDTQWDIAIGLIIGGLSFLLIYFLFSRYRNQLK